MDDNRRREASLVTSAMLGSTISGMCMVMCYWGSWVRSGWDGDKEITKGQREPGEKGKGFIVW